MSGNRFQKTALGLLAVMVIALGSYVAVQAAAYSGTVYGRTTWHGYFRNGRDTSGIEVLPAISGGQAIPSSVNTVSELIALLRAANTSSNTQKKTGSAFIVYTMLGLNGANYSRTVSAANWTEITDRLNARQAKGKIAWGGNVSNSINSYYQGGGDDAWFDEYHNEAGIRIYNDDGSIGYELLRRCANPMGRDGEVQKDTPDPDPIDGSGSSVGCQPMLVTVTPGQDVNGNGIPTRVSTSLRSYGPYTSPATINITNPHTTGDIYTVTYRETRSWISGYRDVAVRDRNGVIIRYDSVPVYSPARSWTSTIGPCYAYKLIPTVTVIPNGVVEPGASYNVRTGVTNNPSGGYHSKSKATAWQVTRIVIAPGANVPTNSGVINFGPCTSMVYKTTGVTCTTALTTPVSGSTTPSFPRGYTPLTNNNFTTDDLEVGTRICYGLSLKPNASSYLVAPLTDGSWIHSKPTPDPKCLRLGKRPKTQVHSGDLSVGKTFKGSTVSTPSTVQTSTSIKSANMFGSWIEYGIFATGQVTGAASGSAYAGPNGTTNTDKCKNSQLSFKNTDYRSLVCTAGDKVGYSNVPAQTIPDFVASFPGTGTAIAGSVIANNLASGIYSATNLTLRQSVLAPGKSVILKVSGTVTIADNQTNSPTNNGPKYTSILQLPQLVIIADNIIIEDDVTNVDAWLIASGAGGTIKTCSSAARIYTECDQPLTVNGPVMAKKLYLLRTGGSGVGPESGYPAEIFNLRPDAYLWSVAQAAGQARVQTVYTTELPPRL